MPTESTTPGNVDIGILTVIPPELNAVRSVLGKLQRTKEGPNDTIYLRGSVRSELRERDYSFVLASIGSAGNASSSALATQMIERYRPSVVLLVGIAAGMRGKVRIGDVVLSERVVAYEHEALTVDGDGARGVEPRSKMPEVPWGILQDTSHYQPDGKRLSDVFARILGEFPPAPSGQEEEWRKHVASSVTCKAQVTIASGEKLLKDPDKLREVRRLHGKVEVGEMEAAGLVEGCRLRQVPWLVIRGISDFGDALKDDRFHELASKSAAAVLADFLAHGLDLGERGAKAGQKSGTPRGEGRANPFVRGLPIERDQDFLGRKREQGEILHAVENGSPVQLLGRAKMGKSSLLRWVERHVPGADRWHGSLRGRDSRR
jgi:nucleoside phosphorylase